MKRLLAYLFIVLGLGLVFSANGNADSGPGYCVEGLTNTFYYDDGDKKYFKKGLYPVFKLKNRTKGRTCIKKEFISKARYPSQYKNLKKDVGVFKTHKSIPLNKIISSIQGTHVFDEYNRIYETQIAKVEPSQTQEVASNDIVEIEKRLKSNGVFLCATKDINKKVKDFYHITQVLNHKCNKYSNQLKGISLSELIFLRIKYSNVSCNLYTVDADGHPKCKRKDPNSSTSNYALKYTENDFKKYGIKLKPNALHNIGSKYYAQITNKTLTKQTQIAKAEPSQTQKVVQNKSAGHAAYCLAGGTYAFIWTFEDQKKWTSLRGPNNKCNWDAKEISQEKFFDIIFNKKLKSISENNLNKKQVITQLVITKNKLIKQGFDKFLIAKKTSYYYGRVLNQNIIEQALKINNNRLGKVVALAENKPIITPKKKVKVAKKEEPKTEEFKPENKDNEAPIIEIAEAITVNDSTYEIEGKVIDKSKKLFVQIDGETIPVKKGKFKIKRFSPVDEQLKIVALDQWGNKSKPKLVNITIDLKETELAEKLEQLNPSLIKSKSNKNRVALIIGIEKYEQTPAANFANLDAQYFYEYARKGFGIPKSNIKLLVDEDADLVKSISTINKWLPSKIKKNKTELVIFFAGHGLASNNGEELYILPQDSDPDLLSRTALSRTELFEQIISLNPKSVTMFMDTCYSGISRDEQMLLASARPIRIVADDEEGIPDNFTIFTASKLDQISSGLEEAKHGIFSYYLMKGLEGKADSNQDKKITNGELLAYMDENVSQKAAELGREQNPSLAGDPDKVLISYR